MKRLSNIRGCLKKDGLERIYRATAHLTIAVTAVLVLILLATGGRYA